MIAYDGQIIKEPPALVKNAADPVQVKKAGEKQQSRREKELNDLRFVLSYQQGRRFLWRMLGYCKVFESIWRPSAEIHHLSGKQDCGHFLMGEIVEANQDSFLTMQKEAKQEAENG